MEQQKYALCMEWWIKECKVLKFITNELEKGIEKQRIQIQRKVNLSKKKPRKGNNLFVFFFFFIFHLHNRSSFSFSFIRRLRFALKYDYCYYWILLSNTATTKTTNANIFCFQTKRVKSEDNSTIMLNNNRIQLRKHTILWVCSFLFIF